MNKNDVYHKIIDEVKPFYIRYNKQQELHCSNSEHEMMYKSQLQRLTNFENKSLRKQKNRRNSKIFMSKDLPHAHSQEKQQSDSKIKSRNLSYHIPVNKQERKVKDVRIPIQYHDEDRNLHELNSKRMVYKGYTPRNSYYFLKTLRDQDIKNNDQILSIRKDCELAFNSKFQCGNLNYAIKVSATEYNLYMRQDTNTKGLRQWFFFQTCNKKPIKIKFRIYKFTKPYSLYQKGFKPFILTHNEALEGKNWIQKGQNVKYQFDSIQKCYYLEFQHNFELEQELTYFATLPPYTYSDLNRYLEELKQHQYLTKFTIGQSLSGLQIPAIQINQPSDTDKQFIIVLARTHPGQTVSSYALEGFIESIINHPFLKKRFTFIIVPMINVDGVFIGNHRTGILGQDLNRHFDKDDEDLFPEIVAVKKLVKNIKRRGKVRFLFDLHGHSAKRGIFAFAGQQQKGSAKFVYNQILPLILSNQTEIFSYESCVFKTSRQKKDCARMHFMRNQKIISITFEQSYGLYYDPSLMKNMPIGIYNWRNFGRNLVQALESLSELIYMKDDHLKILREYMPQLLVQQDKSKTIQQKNTKTMDTQTKTHSIMNSSTSKANSVKEQKEQARRSKLEDIAEDINDYQSVENQNLESEDEELELNEEQFEKFQKQVKAYLKPERTAREMLNLAEKSFELDQLQRYRMKNQRYLHVIKELSPVRKIRIQQPNTISQKPRREQIKLSHLQLPLINKR